MYRLQMAANKAAATVVDREVAPAAGDNRIAIAAAFDALYVEHVYVCGRFTPEEKTIADLNAGP